jgi:site-specific DNA-methyltransferase (adenine-specific)
MNTDRIELRLGTWQSVLRDVEADCLITDPPFAPLVHKGHNRGVRRLDRSELDYDPTPLDSIEGFVDFWVDKIRNWMVILTDHISYGVYREALERHDRLVFAPVVFVESGRSVRLQGDGPACWSTFMVISRPRGREFSKWGALPGAYVLPSGRRGKRLITGSKPLWLMRQLISDYSREQDIIVDPFAGSGTTLLAGAMEGRKVIGAESSSETFDVAQKRIDAFKRSEFFFDKFLDKKKYVCLEDVAKNMIETEV